MKTDGEYGNEYKDGEKIENNNQYKNVSKMILPNTGRSRLVIIVIITIGFTITFYVKLKKYKDIK